MVLGLAAVAIGLREHRMARVSPLGVEAGLRPLEIELSGCTAVLDGPTCELPDDGALRVWVRAPPGAVTFATPAGSLSATTLREIDGGTLHRVILPAGTTELRVAGNIGVETRLLRLARRNAPAWFVEATAARRRGDIDGTEKLVRAGEGSSDPSERAFALGLRARLELAAGHQEASFPLFRESTRLHRQAGRISDAADDSFALAFALNQRSHRYAEARAVLDDVHEWIGSYPDGRAREAYYRGTLATETGDARAALRLLGEARERAARIGLTALERNALNAYALQLELLGRAREALDVLRRLEAEAGAADAPPCEKVEIAINLGFGTLLANAQTETAEDAAPALERALAIEACKDTYLRTAALGNLALAALQRGDPAGARARLAHARMGVGESRGVEQLFWHDLEGRIALAEAKAAEALSAFEEEARLAQSMLSFEAEWRAAVGKGEALELLGRNDAALDSYLAAEKLLSTLSLLVPLGEGRGTFVGDRGTSARLAIDLLVRLRRTDEALAIARSSRARIVAALAQSARVEGFSAADRARWEDALGSYRGARAALDTEAKDDWKLPRTEVARARAARERRETVLKSALDHAFAVLGGSTTPAPPSPRLARLPPGDLTLAFHPVRKGWIALVADASGVTSFGVSQLPAASDASQVADRVLVPIRSQLQRARRLRVLPYGALRSVDFHALPFDGEPLATRLAVEYPLDVPERSPREPASGPLTALVITDPTLDLASARTENDHVVQALRDRGLWEVNVLEGRRATSAAVLPLFPRAHLLHYAGHGVFAGREGWQSALPLAAGSHLAMSDVLASGSVPSRVVLSGCETGRASEDAPGESLGLAHAFVIAGADFVIAPVRPVDDKIAARISAALYGGLTHPGDVDAAAILRDAQLRLRTETPEADWSAFRVVSR